MSTFDEIKDTNISGKLRNFRSNLTAAIRNRNRAIRKIFARKFAINHLSFFTACKDVELPLEQVIMEIDGTSTFAR